MQGKIVLITGGAKRVGAAICRRLHAAGANLMLHYRTSAGEARLLQAELNGVRADSVALIQADLLDLHKLPAHGRADGADVRPARRARQQRLVVLPDAGRRDHRRKLGRPDRHQPARAAVPRAGRGAGAQKGAGSDRQHRRHPRRAPAQEFRRLLDREGRR